MELNVNKAAAKVGELLAIFAAIGLVGSMWIDREVERRMNELAIDPSSAPAVVANTTKLHSLETGQARIEGKVDKFSQEFLRYLERQAE